MSNSSRTAMVIVQILCVVLLLLCVLFWELCVLPSFTFKGIFWYLLYVGISRILVLVLGLLEGKFWGLRHSVF